MFFAIIFIAIGIALFLGAVGLLTGSFWQIFWAAVFLAVGIKMLKNEKCPICEWGFWKGKIGGKIHGTCCEEQPQQPEKPRKQK